MKPEQVETHLSAKTSKGKRTASESVDDGRSRKKKKKNEKIKMEADRNKKKKSYQCCKPLQEPNISRSLCSSSGSLRTELGSRPDSENNGEQEVAPTAGENQLHVDENNNSSFASEEKKQEVNWLQPIEESDSESRSQPNPNTQKTHKEKHHRSKSRRKDKQQGDTDPEKPQRRVCELPINRNPNSFASKSKKKNKDCEEKNKKAETRESENRRSEEGGKDQGGTKKSTTEKKRKKDHLEKDKSKKKVKIEQTERKTEDNKKDKEEDSKWKWWEEGHTSDGRKWSSLEHHGPLFPPPYEPLPSDVHFYYNGELLKLSLATEEVATFYAKMLDHEYTSKPVFQENFFSDWREEMTSEEKALIRKLSKCDFTEISKYFLLKSEERKAMTKEQKKVLKEEASQLTEEYGFCVLDGHREKIGNFRVEPPGLFRGRGEHPKMGKLKRRVQPEDVSINCSKDSKIPAPPEGHKWKKVQHDDTVTWLASWVENVQGNIKYVMLNPSSKLKGEKDWQKYEVARKLKEKVSAIRRRYREDWKDREMKTRQKGVALYFIDKLALRAGNEKEESETADTVGCCSLRVEHIKLHPLLDDQENVVEFDFLGKDSIRYYNKVPVENRVFKNLKLFMENKDPEDDLFDRINTAYLNKHLNQAMPGLTAKVFRTFNASTTLQEQLNQLTSAEMSVEEKLLSYNRANRAVAILCNHQRAAPKTFEKSMQLLQDKISQKEQQLEAARKELKAAKKDHKREQSDRTRRVVEKKEAAVKRLEEQLKKLILQMTDREENKVIALGTSKLNYLDPRISVAWCKKFNVPIEKIYNKTQRDKFAWAIDMTDDTFTF